MFSSFRSHFSLGTLLGVALVLATFGAAIRTAASAGPAGRGPAPYPLYGVYAPPASAADTVEALTAEQALGVQSISQTDFANGGATVKAAGANFLHMGVEWGQLAPTDREPAAFNWAVYDTTLQNASSLGYEVMATLGQNPDWAASYERGPIDCVPLSRFTDYVTAVASRYSVAPYNVQYWAIYNEPDAANQTNSEIDCSGDTEAPAFGENPADYVATLQAAYDAIKAVDPNAIVLLGGLAHDWFVTSGGQFIESFPDDILTLGAGNYFDVMNFHYYPQFDPRWESLTGLPGIMGKTQVMLDLLDSHGLDKPIVCSELGQSSGGQYVGDPRTQDTQAIEVFVQFTRALAAGNKVGIWYNMNDYPDPYGFGEHGLLDNAPDYDPKLSLSAYGTLAAYLPGYRYYRALGSTAMGASDLEAYVFWDTVNDKILTILWSADGSAQTITLPAGVTAVVDKFDSPVSYSSTLSISEQPRLITQSWAFHFLNLPLIVR